MENLRHGRIIVVDDDRSIRLIVSSLLERRYEVHTVASAEEAREALHAFDPDLAILDIDMPYENGWQLCAHLRQERKFEELPVIFLSGLTDAASVVKGLATGGDYYLAKPFECRKLLAVVRTLIRRRLHH